MGTLARLGSHAATLVSVCFLLFVVGSILFNAEDERRIVNDALYAEKAAEMFPKLRSNEFLSDGMKRADQRSRSVWLPAFLRWIVNTTAYRIINVHPWLVWAFFAFLVFFILLLWSGQRNQQISAQRDAAMITALTGPLAKINFQRALPGASSMPTLGNRDEQLVITSID